MFKEKTTCDGDTDSPVLRLRKGSSSLLNSMPEIMGQRTVKLEPDALTPAPGAQGLHDTLSEKMRNKSASASGRTGKPWVSFCSGPRQHFKHTV